MMPRGIADGAGAVRFLGVARRARILETELTDWKLRETVKTALQNVGRGVVLQAEPEALACFLRYLLTRPAVVTYEMEDDKPVLAAYAGRGLTGWISLRRAMAAMKKQLPDTVQISDEVPPDRRKEEKAQKKQERAEKRKARREAREAKKKKTEKPQEKAESTASKDASEKTEN